jgi:hypothetical protein
MDLTFLSEFIVVITLAFCLGVGYVIKTSLDFIPNKYIPLIMGAIGVLFNCFVSGAIDPNVIVAGLISGLASTGMYELFRNFIEKK